MTDQTHRTVTVTEPRRATLAYITSPAKGVVIFNAQYSDGGQVERTLISQNQLRNIVKDGAGALT